MMQEHEVLKRQRQHICLDIGKSMDAAFQVANCSRFGSGLDADDLNKDVVEEHNDGVDGGNDERSSFEHGPPTTTD